VVGGGGGGGGGGGVEYLLTRLSHGYLRYHIQGTVGSAASAGV